ncbi:MAG: hypothetical protein A3J38_04015 [Gammaproteobacteria bacterium RIFCSPHIGHO2_12_FULL_45_9]|nr:MAG: hypothetical protein A3J38_04015 [Gammaproteobacteria bacterium RIFCSPHIGHO2_12_FULL_45_9]
MVRSEQELNAGFKALDEESKAYGRTLKQRADQLQEAAKALNLTDPYFPWSVAEVNEQRKTILTLLHRAILLNQAYRAVNGTEHPWYAYAQSGRIMNGMPAGVLLSPTFFAGRVAYIQTWALQVQDLKVKGEAQLRNQGAKDAAYHEFINPAAWAELRDTFLRDMLAATYHELGSLFFSLPVAYQTPEMFRTLHGCVSIQELFLVMMKALPPEVSDQLAVLESQLGAMTNRVFPDVLTWMTQKLGYVSDDVPPLTAWQDALAHQFELLSVEPIAIGALDDELYQIACRALAEALYEPVISQLPVPRMRKRDYFTTLLSLPPMADQSPEAQLQAVVAGQIAERAEARHWMTNRDDPLGSYTSVMEFLKTVIVKSAELNLRETVDSLNALLQTLSNQASSEEINGSLVVHCTATEEKAQQVAEIATTEMEGGDLNRMQRDQVEANQQRMVTLIYRAYHLNKYCHDWSWYKRTVSGERLLDDVPIASIMPAAWDKLVPLIEQYAQQVLSLPAQLSPATPAALQTTWLESLQPFLESIVTIIYQETERLFRILLSLEPDSGTEIYALLAGCIQSKLGQEMARHLGHTVQAYAGDWEEEEPHLMMIPVIGGLLGRIQTLVLQRVCQDGYDATMHARSLKLIDSAFLGLLQMLTPDGDDPILEEGLFLGYAKGMVDRLHESAVRAIAQVCTAEMRPESGGVREEKASNSPLLTRQSLVEHIDPAKGSAHMLQDLLNWTPGFFDAHDQRAVCKKEEATAASAPIQSKEEHKP